MNAYLAVEGSDISRSTLGHQHFVEELSDLKSLLDTIQRPSPTEISETASIASSNTDHFDALAYTGNISFQDDDLFTEIQAVSQGIWQMTYLLHQAMIRYNTGMSKPSDLAEAAWVVRGACMWATGVIAFMQEKSGIQWPGLLDLIGELHLVGEIPTLEILPLHEYVKQFERTAKELIGNSLRSVTNPGPLKPAKAKELQRQLHNLKHSAADSHNFLKQLLSDIHALYRSASNDSGAQLWEEVLKTIPLGLASKEYVKSRTKANAIVATIEATFLLHTTALNTGSSTVKMFETSFQQVTGFAGSVRLYLRNLASTVLKLFSQALLERLDCISNLCELIQKLQFSTANCLPWTLGSLVLVILACIDLTTSTMIHQHKIVGVVVHAYNALRHKQRLEPIAIFETITKMLQLEIFPKNVLPIEDFGGAFAKYVKDRPPVVDDLFSTEELQRGSPSIVHQHSYPTFKFEMYKKLRARSADPASLPIALEWTAAESMKELRYTADKEFNSSNPVARANFIAIFLLCTDFLEHSDKPSGALHNPQAVARMVEKITKVLDTLDLKDPKATEASGDVQVLVAALRNFKNRTEEAVLWRKL